MRVTGLLPADEAYKAYATVVEFRRKTEPFGLRLAKVPSPSPLVCVTEPFGLRLTKVPSPAPLLYLAISPLRFSS